MRALVGAVGGGGGAGERGRGPPQGCRGVGTDCPGGKAASCSLNCELTPQPAIPSSIYLTGWKVGSRGEKGTPEPGWIKLRFPKL